MSDTDHNTHNTNQHALTCMEIWGGNQAFDNAVSVPGIDAWVHSRPFGEGETGGDVHYVSMCGCGEIGRFFLADLSGHGESASQPAVDLRRLMRKYINTLDQTDFVRSLNDRMMEWKQQGQFATTLLSTYFAPTRQMLICNAGHPAPLRYRAATREWQWMQTETAGQPPGTAAADNLPVGIVEGTEYIQFAVELEKDDRVLIYSDSLYESRDASGDQLGREGLLSLMNELADLPPEERPANWSSASSRTTAHKTSKTTSPLCCCTTTARARSKRPSLITSAPWAACWACCACEANRAH